MITEEKLSTQKEIQDQLEAHNVFATRRQPCLVILREIETMKVKKNDMIVLCTSKWGPESYNLIWNFCLII